VQNFIYALIQVVHNLGAATVVGAAVSAISLVRGNATVQHRLAWILVVAWAIQGASGLLFGVTTFFFEGQLPDIHGIAVDALLIKMVCVMTGLIVAMVYLKSNSGWTASKRMVAWNILLTLGVLALGSAAFLRWFS
jgi:hypothetical protein